MSSPGDPAAGTSGFERLGETEVVAGYVARWVDVTFRSPDGALHTREVVHHSGAVAVVPLHEDGSVTLVRQYRVALDALCLELPAGLRDVAGEPEATTARRELIEEAGLSCENLEHLVTFHNSPGFSDETVAVFLATELREVPHDRQGVEEQTMTVERRRLAEALEAVANGEITDAKTIIGLSLVAQRG